MPEMHIPDVPAEVLRAIVSDAEAKGTSRNEIAVSILAEHFRVKREPSGAPYRSRMLDLSEPLKLRVPDKLRDKIRVEAARTGATIRGVVVAALAQSYGLPVPSPGRRART